VKSTRKTQEIEQKMQKIERKISKNGRKMQENAQKLAKIYKNAHFCALFSTCCKNPKRRRKFEVRSTKS